MITHRAIAARFKAGESVGFIAMNIHHRSTKCWHWDEAERKKTILYVEHALREVLKRQKWQG